MYSNFGLKKEKEKLIVPSKYPNNKIYKPNPNEYLRRKVNL